MTMPPQTDPRQNFKIFGIYNIYRLVLSLILLITFILGAGSVLGAHDRDLFFKAGIFYLIINILIFLRAHLSKVVIQEARLFAGVIIIDILVLVLLSYTCGGVGSSIAHLLIIPIAAGSILLQNRFSIFLAAIGTIAVIYSEVYLHLSSSMGDQNYVQAGVLGITLFATALIVQTLGRRIRQNEQIAQQRAEDIASLENMNYHIIQRMRTGIIVVDSNQRILNYNTAAASLLNPQGQVKGPLESLPPVLLQQLENWKSNHQKKSPPFRLNKSGPRIQASFAYLNPNRLSNVLIFLEDDSLLTSRVQQLKLVSLGRLTASIAHEIRNPLGAISHAGQLLTESDILDDSDRRLVEIIIDHSQRVNAIIENILQISRSKGEISETIELVPWLEHFIERFSRSYELGTNIRLAAGDCNPRITTNTSQLEQLMTNLCDNGIRYSMKATGKPSLLLQVNETESQHIPYLDIIDEGEGIAAEDEEKIFEPFFTTESQGTGLGLYICKEICEANQAQLNYRRSDEGKSCFRITFPHPGRVIA